MKAIKGSLLGISILLLTAMTGCDNKKEIKKEDKPVMEKEATLEMSKDSIDSRVIADLEKQILERKVKLTEEALSTIGETQSLLQEVRKGNTKEAIKKGEILIGRLEVLLTSDPGLTLIPIDVRYEKHELITDTKTVRKITKEAQKAMDDGYYQLAGDLLQGLKSEMVINTFKLPTATYPEAIKAAVVFLKEDKPKMAEALLAEVLGTIIVEKTVLPLPVLNAEQMIFEAAEIDAKDHENVDKVINLLKNADYQLNLAEELGYGKKDKEYALMAKEIKTLKKSVSAKEDSTSKFDSLKEKIRKFKDSLIARQNK